MAHESIAPSVSRPVLSPEEAVMAQVWEDVLQIEGVGPDDDFFSCGGDSLLAITVVGEAHRRGLEITMLHLFKYPTVRGMCEAAVADGAKAPQTVTDLLSPADRAKVPAGSREAMPATRLQLGMVYESLMSDGEQYVCTVVRDIRRPLDEPKLRAALDLMTERHEMLRMRFDLSNFSEAVQIVAHSADIPLTVADHTALDAAERARRETAIREELGRPFDPEQAPLLRFHAAATGPESFRLSYAYHHAVLDGWSAASLLHELVVCYARSLAGEETDFGRPLPFAEFVRLERAAARSEESAAHFAALAADMPPGTSRRGTPRTVDLDAVVPDADAEGLIARAGAWRLPVKSLLLAAHSAAIAGERGESRADIALLMNGRPEQEGSDLTLGLFINYLPLRVGLEGADWRLAAERAFDAERDLLPHRRYPHAEALGVVGSRPFEASFNYLHLRRGISLVEDGLVEARQFADVRFDIPLCVDVQNTGDRMKIHVGVDTSFHDEEFGRRLMARILDGIHRIATSPDSDAVRP
ncbi:condensation domain-containing protein [Streptomyces clavuligerus]|uniref:Condensation / PCP domain protein n=1 Tax=Streptomyces clavuligerus TaxID=1901 RepID=B5GS00_STRCL|nr:condensation domain-containing protein [Streptomyces clavuligerus]EDY49096.1 hypothetical protein SSCG_02124 [Streptomyces clavuligerus]EFG03792.1 Condensation / PCP domain protein [Streptomyces clavuligerus]MBY6307678.1 condensation protein [Streptomyces clavuligerus]QCS09775.1 condensation protein [Streptomyces clavuligerus]QPJ98183.1 condensation protein [Streptomyces clavuligerus]